MTKQPINYLEFNNPIHVIWRKGTPSDPFVDRLDITRVVNQRIALLEIPDELYRVRISGMFEVNYEYFIKDRLAVNEFYCDYTNGFVYFHQNKEASTISAIYKGRGVLLYPSSRILHYDGTNTAETLYEIIEKSKLQIQELVGRTESFEEVLERMVIATNLTQDATNQSLQVTQEAKNAVELVNDAYYTTVLIYQPYVQNYDDIFTTYTNPNVGWTVQVYDSGIRYRYNGNDWIPIDALGGNIPNATELYDGLMSKEDFTKVQAISEYVNEKTIVFVCPEDILQGVQSPHIIFPHDGEITEIIAYVSKTGLINAKIDVQVSQDFVSWTNVTNNPINIDASKYKDDGLHTITTTTVASGDVFRLNVPDFNNDAQNLQLNIKIKIN